MPRALRLSLAIAALALLSCLEPLLRPGEFTDIGAGLAGKPELERFDSLQVEFRDGGDTGLIIAAWRGSRNSLDAIPLQLHPKGRPVFARVRGYKDSIGYCFTAWFRNDSLINALDSCEIPVVHIKAFAPADTVISINDPVVFRATATSRSGILKEFRWDFDGDGKPDSSGPISGAMAEIRATHLFGNALGAVKVRLTVLDADSNTFSRMATVHVDKDPPIASAGPDTSVALGDSLLLKGSGTDGKGRIVSAAWYGASDTAALTRDNRLVVHGKGLGSAAYVLRVTDDDGEQGTDTIFVKTILPDSNSSLRAIYAYPGVLSPAFSPERSEYRLVVPLGTDSFKVTARPAKAGTEVTFLDVPGASYRGDLVRSLPFSGDSALLRIRVVSAAGIGSEYSVSVVQGTAKGFALGYARVPDPASAGPGLGNALAYNSAGGGVRFSRSGPGRYAVAFPGLGEGLGFQGHVQAVAYGAVPGRCAVESQGGTDSAIHLACFDAQGAESDIPFGLAATWPRTQSNGGNAYLSYDAIPSSDGQKPQSASAYNSVTGAPTGGIYGFGMGTGMMETDFLGINPIGNGLGNALITLRGREPGWCRISSLRPGGVDVIVMTTCYDKGGAPADHLISMQAIMPTPLDGIHAIAYAVAPGPTGFDDPGTDPERSFNSTGGAISTKRLGKGRYQVRFAGLETAGPERMGAVLVSAYGDEGTGFCQVEGWTPSEGTAVIRCSDPLGQPEDSWFSIQAVR